MDSSIILSSAIVCAAGVMSPGPNFVAVSHRAVTATRAEALALVGGVVLVNAVWAAAALFGLHMVFLFFPWLFWTIKLMGAAYLVWFGWRLLRHAARPLPEKGPAVARQGLARAWRDGVLTNLANPKSMVFYASVFSASVPAGAPAGALTGLVGVVIIVASLWYGGVAVVLSTEKIAARYRRGKIWIERLCGVFLVAFGFRQALSR